jgi:hypothetical protein
MKAWLKENEIPCCDTMFKVHDLVKTTSIKRKKKIHHQPDPGPAWPQSTKTSSYHLDLTGLIWAYIKRVGH